MVDEVKRKFQVINNPHTRNIRINMTTTSPRSNSHEDGVDVSLVTQFLKTPLSSFALLAPFPAHRRYTSFSPFIFGQGYFVSLVVFSLMFITSPTAKLLLERLIRRLKAFFWAGVSWFMSALQNYGQVWHLSSKGALLPRFCGRFFCALGLFPSLGFMATLIHATSLNYPAV